jgi:hypothetical protein
MLQLKETEASALRVCRGDGTADLEDRPARPWGSIGAANMCWRRLVLLALETRPPRRWDGTVKDCSALRDRLEALTLPFREKELPVYGSP